MDLQRLLRNTALLHIKIKTVLVFSAFRVVSAFSTRSGAFVPPGLAVVARGIFHDATKVTVSSASMGTQGAAVSDSTCDDSGATTLVLSRAVVPCRRGCAMQQGIRLHATANIKELVTIDVDVDLRRSSGSGSGKSVPAATPVQKL